MHHTASSLNKFGNEEVRGRHPAVIIQFVKDGKKVARVPICEGSNAYKLASDFLRTRHDIPNSKRDQLAHLIQYHLQEFTQ